ncbi:MAG: hypothetical protein V9E94_04910 [Microthrixaceae bacterium]
MDLPVQPPLAPMLAKASPELPDGARGQLLVRAQVGRLPLPGVPRRRRGRARSRATTSRCTRYFPELLDPLRAALPDALRARRRDRGGRPRDGLDFDALQQRIHPAERRG